MDQQLYYFRPVLLIRRRRQIELHCADDWGATACDDDATGSRLNLRQNSASPKLACVVERERNDETYPRARMYDRVEDFGQHVDFGIDGSRWSRASRPVLDPDFF